jgi:hypothetical protein
LFFCHPEERRTTQETPQSNSTKKNTHRFVISTTLCHPEERRTTQETPQSNSTKKSTHRFVISTTLCHPEERRTTQETPQSSSTKKIKQSLAQCQLNKVKAHKINNKTLWSYVVELLVWSFVPQDDKALSR